MNRVIGNWPAISRDDNSHGFYDIQTAIHSTIQGVSMDPQ